MQQRADQQVDSGGERGEWSARVGELIRQYRTDRGWTQAYLGQQLGADQRAISRLENGTPEHSLCRVRVAALVALNIPRPIIADVMGFGGAYVTGRTGGLAVDMDEPRARAVWTQLISLDSGDQAFVIETLERLVHYLGQKAQLIAKVTTRHMIHVVGLLTGTAMIDVISDGRLDGVVHFVRGMCRIANVLV